MTPADNPTGEDTRRRRGRWGLILIALLFFVPIWSAMYLVERWRPAGTVNHGVLVDPLQQVDDFEGRAVDGSQVAAGYFADHWTLVYYAETGCGEPCGLALYYMRQVRIALGKDMDRVRRLLLVGSEPDYSLASMLEMEHPRVDVLVTEVPTPFDHVGAIHVVDPLGNLMMYYPPGVEPKGMLDDLKRLLKLSKIG